MENKRIKILESCSEDAHGSWEFWSDGNGKQLAEAELITQAIKGLVSEKLIIPTEHEYIKDRTYKEVSLDSDRLKREVQISINTDDVDVTSFYHFLATPKGEEQDISNRSA